MLPSTMLAGLTVASRVTTEAYAEWVPVQPDRPPRSLERRYTDETSEFVRVGDARVHYRDEGPRDAPALVALHGAYSSLHTWDGWVEELTDEVRFVRLDLPGLGLTGPNDCDDYSLSYYVETLAEFCDALGLDSVTVAGNSLGGAIAWRFAATRPGRVDGLVLVDAARQQLLPPELGAWMQPGLGLLTRYATPRLSIRRVLGDAYADPSNLSREVVRRYHDLLLRTGNRRAVLQIARDAERSEVSPGVIDCPTLIQWGEEDEWLQLSLAERFSAEIPASRLVTYPNVGHVAMEEAPGRTAADVRAFLTD